MVKGVSSDAMEIVEPAKEGYQLTLRINFDKIPRGKGLVILHFNDIQNILGT
jgi:actin related protein 2/3 complex subunit 2